MVKLSGGSTCGSGKFFNELFELVLSIKAPEFDSNTVFVLIWKIITVQIPYNYNFTVCFVMSFINSFEVTIQLKCIHYTANATTKTQKQSDYKVELSFFTLIALF